MTISNIRKTLLVFTGVALLLTALPLSAAQTLRLGRTRELTEASLIINLFNHTTERALPSPSSSTLRYTRGTQKWEEEVYNIKELWLHDQHVGEWTDDYNRTLSLRKMNLPLPPAQKNNYITQEKYNTWKESVRITDESSGALTSWVNAITGLKVKQMTPVKKPHMAKFKQAYFVEFDKSPQAIGLLFQLPPPPVFPGSSMDLHWFCALFNIIPGDDIPATRELLEKRWLPVVKRIRKGHTRRSEAPNKFQNRNMRPSTDTEELKAGRERVIDSIKNLDNWWFAETPNYIMLSDLKSSSAVTIRKLQSEMDILRAGYTRLLPPAEKPKAVSVIRIFANRRDYENYVGEKHKWSAGLWSPARKELVVSSPNWSNKGAAQDQLRNITYHEGLHQYLSETIPGIQTSPWFNEGHAELFTYSEVRSKRSKRMKVTESENQLRYLEKIISSKALNLSQFITISYQQFYSTSDETRRNNYATAWALCYYLHKGYLSSHDKIYKMYIAEIVPAYLEALRNGSRPEEATRIAFKEIDMELLTTDFINFWDSRNRRGDAKRKLLFK